MQKESISDQHLQQLGKQAIEKIKAIETNPKWEKFSDKPCPMYRMTIDSRVAAKGEEKVKYSIDQVFEFLYNDQVLKALNSQLKEVKVIYELKQFQGQYAPKVLHQHYHGIWPVADRDFVILSMSVKESENYYIAAQSCEYEYPQIKKVVRGKINIGGYILKKISEKQTLVIYVADSDLCGSIPGMIQNKLSEKQGAIASKVNEEMSKK